MKNPIVLDGEEANKYGLINAVVLQKVREGRDTIASIHSSLPFLKKDEISKSIKELTAYSALKSNGIKIVLYSSKEDKSIIPSNRYTPEFEEVWKSYNKDKPNKGSKKKAYERYNKSVLNELPLIIQKNIIDEYRYSVSDVKFMKHFSTFLSEEIYEEYLPEECSLETKNGLIKGFLMNDVFYYLRNDGVYSTYSLNGKIEEYKNKGILICN